MMFKSEESLANSFGYSREHVCMTMIRLSRDGLISRGEKHNYLQSYDYIVDIVAVITMLGLPNCKDPNMLKAFRCSIPKQTFEWCIKILQPDARKLNIPCEISLQLVARKPYTTSEEILHANKDNNKDNIKDNDITTLSKQAFKTILLPVFFFKNDCHPMPEMNRFIDYYYEKCWKLGGGKVITSVEELVRTAESWTVKDPVETGFTSGFIRGWKEVYKVAPDSLKIEFLKIKTPRRSPTSSTVICSKVVKDWLDDNKDRVEQIFKTLVTYNYKIDWEAPSSYNKRE